MGDEFPNSQKAFIPLEHDNSPEWRRQRSECREKKGGVEKKKIEKSNGQNLPKFDEKHLFMHIYLVSTANLKQGK